MNIGKAAGAGIAGHIHMHALPRWVADANFMTVVGETRVLPESLEKTYDRIKGARSIGSCGVDTLVRRFLTFDLNLVLELRFGL